jgi:hypothetical protein
MAEIARKLRNGASAAALDIAGQRPERQDLAPAAGRGRLLNEIEAADYLNVSVSAMRAWRWKGGGPVFVHCGRLVRYGLPDLDAWIEQNKRTSTSAQTAI